MKFIYPAHIKKDKDGRFLVQFKDFSEAITEGETLEEALFNAQDVLALTIESRIDEGEEIPNPSNLTAKSIYWISPPARIQSALLIHRIRKEKKKTVAELARSLNTSWLSASRLENPRHSPNLKQLERAAAALGKQVVIQLQ